METQTTLALQTYEVWELHRNKALVGEIKSLRALKHMKEGVWNWESNIDLPFEEITQKLATVFSIAHSEHWNIVPTIKYVLTNNHKAVVLDLEIKEDTANYTLYGSSLEEISATETSLLNTFKSFKLGSTVAEKICAFRFHHHSEEGIVSKTRDLDAVGLTDLKHNYTPEVYNQAQQLLDFPEPYKAGKIILYHGPPGNGKTHLLRAIAYEWYKKFDVKPEVIIDPEPLFSHPGYLMDLLTLAPKSDRNPKFRFIIAEDCANLFGANCRENVGFGRLLNVVDGLLGAGQKLIFLFTANEQIDEIDPAILRPGRCLQHLYIPDWSKKDATSWLVNKGFSNKVDLLKETNSLADLYAMINDLSIYSNRKESFGFKTPE